MTIHVSAERIVAALSGRWRGDHGMCRCPAHDDRLPSLSVARQNGTVLVKCFAGCTQREVLAALSARGLWGQGTRERPRDAAAVDPRDHVTSGEKLARILAARRLWESTVPIQGTLGERYLRARGLKWTLPDELRFINRLLHSESQKTFPALIAPLREPSGKITAVQRTYLNHEGTAKAAVTPAKKTKGVMGASAVRLWPCVQRLGIAEGIETALSAFELYGLPTWAACSLTRLGALAIPKTVHEIVIFADRNKRVVKAGGRTRDQIEDAHQAADRYEAMGLRVGVLTPQADFGKEADDFNDVVRARE